ncbi:MAG: protein-tyrosine-phosphatase [Chloroflexi bacterium]|nr:protein-tyrosine-phosphatase [Chloroflexota bacterium]
MSVEAPDPPLRVDWIDPGAFGDGRAGRLGMTFLPGKRGPSLRYPGRVYRRELERDLGRLTALGVERLLLLVEDGELARWGDPNIVERALQHGIEVARRRLPDGSAPRSAVQMTAMLDWVDAARSDGDVAVACMGGVGRTGTVAACALVRAGWPADAAIAEVRRIRHPTAVETEEQLRFVHDFAG